MRLVLLASLVATALAAFPTAPATRAATDYLWPVPKTVVDHKTTVVLPPGGFQVQALNSNDYFFEDLQAAIAGLHKSLAAKRAGASGSGSGKKYPVTVAIEHKLAGPAQLVGASEAYALNITASGASIRAPSQVGARYALQTLAQLVTAQGALAVADVADAPRFAYRGFMLDTARNFFPVQDLKRLLDGFAAAKINVFHWHIYDSQSFPIKWDSYPQLLKAAYKDAQGKPKVYTEQQVRDLIQYAWQRNIRVIPEFEMPGHNAVFGHIDPSLIASWNHSPWDNFNAYPANNSNPANPTYVGWGRQYCAEPPCGQLDVRKSKAIALLDQLVGEVGAWFADPVLHVGHDEVNARAYGLVPDNWDSVPADATHALMRDFEPKLLSILAKHGKKYAAWDEVAWAYGIESMVPKDAVVGVWSDYAKNLVPAMTKLGLNKIVVAPYSTYYFDCSPSQIWCVDWDYEGGSESFEPPTKYDNAGLITYPGRWHTWEKMYTTDILAGLTESDKKAIYGGSGALWSETVKRHNLDRYVFPRVAAIAEQLWSYDNAPAFDKVKTSERLARFRASLINEHSIDAAALDYLGNQEGVVYRMESCDADIHARWGKSTAASGEAGMPTTDDAGNAPIGDVYANAYYTAFGDFCKTAALYNTNSFVPAVPAKVAYGF
ncbi:glycoside hydrolase superfamily, partial [Obelidium mucronatum]